MEKTHEQTDRRSVIVRTTFAGTIYYMSAGQVDGRMNVVTWDVTPTLGKAYRFANVNEARLAAAEFAPSLEKYAHQYRHMSNWGELEIVEIVETVSFFPVD